MKQDQQVYFSSYQLPIGQVYIASTEQGVCALSMDTENFESFQNWLTKHFSKEQINEDYKFNQHVYEQLAEYFRGDRTTFDLEVDLRGTDFQRKVWQELQQIPFGETLSYKELAIRVGGPTYTRAVGGANNKNPVAIIVPCHRVIGSDGKLVGYAGGLEIKSQLLQLEQGGLFAPTPD